MYANIFAWDIEKNKVSKISLTEYEQHIIFPSGHQKVHSSLWSALLYMWCAEGACMFLADVFLAFHTGVAGLGVISVWTDLAPTTFPACSLNHWRSCTVCLCLDVLHNSCSSSWCSWKAPSSLDMRFHQRVTQLLQENPPSSQCSAVPVLVYLTPYYKGIVGAHVNDVEENYKGPTGSHASAAVCGCDLVQVIYPSLCLLWCSGQHLSAGHFSLSWGNRRRSMHFDTSTSLTNK